MSRQITARFIILAAIIPMTLAAAALAEEKEKTRVIWSCGELFTKERIVWLVEDGERSYVKVFNERINARYKLDGIDKRWDFGLNKNNEFEYAIVLRPDKSASYYNFRASKDRTARAAANYTCTKD